MQLPNQPTLIDKKVKLYTRINAGGTMILDPNGKPAPFRKTVKQRTSKYVRHIGIKHAAKLAIRNK